MNATTLARMPLLCAVQYVKPGLKHQDFEPTKGYPGEGPDLRLLSINIQGAYTFPDKYTHLINYATHKDNKYDIICVQETHSATHNRIRNVLAFTHPNAKSWEAINTDNHNKGGVAIIVLNDKIKPTFVMSDNTTPSNWTDDMTQQEKDAVELDSVTGKWITIRFKWMDKVIHLTNVYAPTLRPKPQQLAKPGHIARKHFFNYLGATLNFEHNIVAGDFNNLPNPEIDKIWIAQPPAHNNAEDMDHFNTNFVQQLHLHDTYLESYDEVMGPVAMTHMSTAKTSYSRIDRFYHSSSLDDYAWVYHLTCRTTDVRPIPITTDHYPVSITLVDPDTLNIKQFKTWKLNTSVFLRTENIAKVQRKLDNIYSLTNDNNIYQKYEQFKKEAAKYMKKVQSKTHFQLQKKKEKLSDILEPNSGYTNEEIAQAKQQLRDISEYELEGKRVTYKALQASQKSRMTKYHFRMAKKHHASTIITHMLDPTDNTVKHSQEDIERILGNYWETIMSKRNTNILPTPISSTQVIVNSIQKRMPEASCRQLGSETDHIDRGDDEGLKQFVSCEAILDSIKSSKLNKAPGIDGFPIEFYDALAKNKDSTIVKMLQKVFIHAYKSGELPPSMRETQIRLLYKKETQEDKKFPKNYRPIALLSVDYKILSKLLAKKLGPHLCKILDETQFCQPGKEIGELILYYQALIDDSERTNTESALAFLDFEKAFDSVDHEFTFTMLQAVGLPKEFIKWAKLAFINTQACLIINGKRSPFFPLPGGGRQGDNLYPMIFAIVVQGLASLIRNHPMIRGIIDENGNTFKIGQFADDTTLGVGCDNDWTHYKQVIDIFCDASGMRMNWDKSLVMWLGSNITNPPRNLPPDAPQDLTIMNHRVPYRVMGARMGTDLPKDSLWQYLKPKLVKMVESDLNHSGDELGDTLIANSMIIGSIIFNTRLQYISNTSIAAVGRWCTFFIRAKNYMLTDQQRYATASHGNICPLIDVNKLIPALVASWSFKLIIQGRPLIFRNSWFRYFAQAVKHYKFRSVDHMLNCTTMRWDTISLERGGNTIPVFAHQSLINLCNMGFRREPIMVFEDLMNQPLFGNRYILNPANNQPWDRLQSPFASITPFQMTTVADLYFSFDQASYKRDPEVRAVRPPDLALANLTFTTRHNRPQIHIQDWNQLYLSIPPEWREIIQSGNQDFNEGEFFATILVGGNIGDIYRYQNGRLHYYTQDHESTLTDTGLCELPGTRVPDSPIPYPALNELKRIYTSKAEPPNLKVICFMLPHKKQKDILPFAGAIPGTYFHSQFPKMKLNTAGNATFKALSKQWRLSSSTIHPRTQQFINDSGLNAHGSQALKPLIKVASKLQVPPPMRVMLHRLINNALYMGVVAHDYQIQKKGVQPNADILVSPVCIYSDYTFSQHYIPRHHIPNIIVPATYSWILWDSPIAKSVWTLAKLILNRIDLNLDASSYHEAIWELVNNNATDGDETDKLKLMAKQNIIVFALWSLYSADKKINNLKQTNQLKDETVDNWIRTVNDNFERLVHEEIRLVLHHRREIAISAKIIVDGRATVAFNEREKVIERLRFTTIHLDKLDANQMDFFKSIWSDLVEFTNQSLIIPPFRREPP